VKALLRAELLKLRSTRTTAGLLLATFALVPLTVATTVPHVGDENAPLSLDDPGLLADTVGVSFGVPLVLMLLFGTLAFTQEFRYGTVTSTYLGEPRRKRVLVAKWLSLALASVVITAATLALSVALGIALIGSRDGDVTLAGHFWGLVASAFVVMAAYGLIGVAIGAFVEQLVIPTFPAVGRWMPFGATNAVFQLGPALSLDGKLLSPSVGGLVLVGYTAAAVLLALVVTPRRDVL
jgi:ABC-type transport system involved in multi-copper enzyme maturation permease subunit